MTYNRGMPKKKICYVIEIIADVDGKSDTVLTSLLSSIHTIIHTMLDAVFSTLQSKRESISIKVGKAIFKDNIDKNTIQLHDVDKEKENTLDK